MKERTWYAYEFGRGQAQGECGRHTKQSGVVGTAHKNTKALSVSREYDAKLSVAV